MTRFVSILIIAACASSTPAATGPAIQDPIPMNERTAEAPVAPVPTEAAMPVAATPASDMLVAYERVRALLAADEPKGIADAARAIQAAATKGGYKAIAASAGKLAGTTDLATARTAFGEVSRAVVALLSSDKKLAKGQHVFECPMVKDGYRKWVQPSDDMANPYMGKKMLACGGESTWD